MDGEEQKRRPGGDEEEEEEELSRMREYNKLQHVIKETMNDDDEEEEIIVVKRKPKQRKWKREDSDVEEEWRPRMPSSSSAKPRKLARSKRNSVVSEAPSSPPPPPPHVDDDDEVGDEEHDDNYAMRFLDQHAASPEDVQAIREGQIERVDASRKRCTRWCNGILFVLFIGTVGLYLLLGTSSSYGRSQTMLVLKDAAIYAAPVIDFVASRVNDVRYSRFMSRIFCKPCNAQAKDAGDDDALPPREFVCDHAVGEHVLWTRGSYLNVTRASVDPHTSSTYAHGEGYVVPPVSDGELRTGMVGQVSLKRIASMLVGTWLRPTMVALKDKTVLCMHEVNHGLPQGDRRVCVVRRHLGNNYLVMINPQLMGWSLEDGSTIVSEYSLGCTGGQRQRVRRDVIEMTYTTLGSSGVDNDGSAGVRMRAAFSDGTEAHQLQRVCEEMRGAYVCNPPLDTTTTTMTEVSK